MSNETVVPPFNAEGLTVSPKVGQGVLQLSLTGAIEMRDPGVLLNPYWIRVDEETRKLGIKQVEVDLRDLSFMNSSGLLTLVRWITRAKSHTAEAYRINLRFDRNVTWQRASIPTLAKLAPEIVTATESNG
jgi:hypothetical protein